MVKKIILVGAVILLVVGVVAGYLSWNKRLSPVGLVKPEKEAYLAQYDFDSLKKRGGIAGEVVILGKIKGVELRRKEKYDFETRQFKFKSQGKWITGMINYFPERSSLSSVVIMIRGYADKEGYYSGFGSWRVADELAKMGIMTVSIDFLGYSRSDGESLDMLEARFEKVIGVLDLIESIKNLGFVDKNRIGIWAHSNGGQIAMSVLEITGANYPTILWAPMTQPFPQSILDTANDLTDGGKAVKQALAEFGKKYDTRRYAVENYYEWIRSPIVIHQGTADEWCKIEWQQAVVDRLTSLGKTASLDVYKGDDHNLSRNWEEIVKKDVQYYRDFF